MRRHAFLFLLLISPLSADSYEDEQEEQEYENRQYENRQQENEYQEQQYENEHEPQKNFTPQVERQQLIEQEEIEEALTGVERL